MSVLMIPIVVFIIVFYGAYKKIDVYNSFITGSKESFDMIMHLFPTMLAMVFAVNIFIKSGLLQDITKFINPFLHILNIPSEIIPMALIRPISGSSSLAILNNILENYGPDSFVGRLASVMQGSTDTTFYVLTLYFGSIGIKKIKYALWSGLFADFIGIISSIVIVHLLF